jgi:Putative beta-lactamase-inhibitor-like, PepSY-like
MRISLLGISAVVFGIGLGLALTFAPARADEEKIPLDKLPPAVRKAVKTLFPKGEIEEAVKEVEGGETIYEIEVADDDNEIVVSVKADGTILEVEKELDTTDLPGFIVKAIEAKYPGSEIETAAEVTAKGKIFYEFLVEQKSGDLVEIVLEPSVTFVKETKRGKEKKEKEEKSKKDKGV